MKLKEPWKKSNVIIVTPGNALSNDLDKIHGNVYNGCKMSIRVLDSRVISQIAAGEVVERPASVVKELVENALDADATQISVEIRGGGLGLIRVTDNGRGIVDEEVALAFQRNATSKIVALHDLQELKTLGFRGEALPSIAAVSQVQMVTSVGELSGTRVVLEDGLIIKHEALARSQGTTVIVQNLFKKIPARLKFMKSTSTEAGRATEVVVQYCLAYPEVRFNLINEGKTTLMSPGKGNLIDSIIAVYGLEVAQNMLEIGTHESTPVDNSNKIKVTGFIGVPHMTRASREYLSFFVNRRWVNSRSLNFAVEEAYHGLLMQGKHPIAVINVETPTSSIDVNVHPSKTEIKFQDERTVFSAIQKSVRAGLIHSSPVPQIEEFKKSFNVPSLGLNKIQPERHSYRPGFFSPTSVSAGEQPTPLMALPLLRVLGQLTRKYILAEGPDALYLLDQHAAHERIMLENIQQQYAQHKVEVQGLLQPVTVELDPRQSNILTSHLPLLNEFGFDLQSFGDRTYLVKAIPAVLRERDWLALLLETLDTQTGDWSENLLNRLACHSAIRAGQVLNDGEMKALVRELEQTKLPNSCPHGRPTLIRLTFEQLEREFGRT